MRNGTAGDKAEETPRDEQSVRSAPLNTKTLSVRNAKKRGGAL